ncbi:MAG: hypothetical protein FWE05_06230 [Defluviitaleaceae bacterium]|nr:hypothetical protein [Defluviitaleaceae bacterium]
MDQRLVKPIFWPMLIVSSVFLAAFMFFLIGGMINSRGEDYFIAGLIGIVFFLAARTVQKNVVEPSTLATGLMFIVPAVVGLCIILMHYQLMAIDFEAFAVHRMPLLGDLQYLQNGIGHIFSYLSHVQTISGYDFPVPEELLSAFYLSGGIIAAVVFVVVQCVTCFLLFVGTKPEKKDHRH